MLGKYYRYDVMCIDLDLLKPFTGEVFKPITEESIENIRPYYMVSTFGRVYNIY